MITTGELPSVVFPVGDLEAAKQIFTALLGEPHTDTPYYVGYAAGQLQIGLNPHGQASGMTTGTVYWPVPDVAAAIAELVAAGAAVQNEAAAVGGGTTIGSVTDADGNSVGLIHADPQ